jgi:hypothetical protein
MKKIIFLFLSGVLLSISSYSQSLDRITLSSGGVSCDSMSATLGELLVFSLTNGGYSFSAGGQSDEENTGGFLVGTAPACVQKENHAISVYPNPVKEVINVKIDGSKVSALYLVLFDAGGKLVMQKTVNFENGLFVIDVHSLAAGSYSLNGYTNSGERLDPVVFTKVE